MIYVDPLVDHGWRLGPSCHLFAAPPDPEALHRLAQEIGCRRSWAQTDGTRMILHYDLVASRRRRAVQAGAAEVTRRDAVALWREHYPRRPR